MRRNNWHISHDSKVSQSLMQDSGLEILGKLIGKLMHNECGWGLTT